MSENGKRMIRLKDWSETEDSSYLIKDGIEGIEKDPKALVYLDFDGLLTLPEGMLRQITVAGMTLRRTRRKFIGLNALETVKRQIMNQGLDGLFDFAAPQPRPGKSIDVQFVNPFIQGVIETLETQCSTPSQPGDIQLRKTFKHDYTIDLIAIIGLASATYKGSIALCFSKQTYLQLIGRMMGEQYTEITDEIRDGAGELLNIIFGTAKMKLNEQGLAVEKAIPRVVYGQDLQTNYVAGDLAIVLPFRSEAGSFHMEIGYDNQV